MKNTITSFIIAISVFLSSFCFYGCSREVEIDKTPESKIFSQEEIVDAEYVVYNEARSNDTLYEVCYAGDDTTKDYYKYKKEYGADDIIVISAFYDVDPNENQDAECYILARKKGGKWEVKGVFF